MNPNIGKIISERRKELNIKQEELAQKLGVSSSAISKWENGANLPDIVLLEPISEVLQVDMIKLLKTDKELAKEEKKTKRKECLKVLKKSLPIYLPIILILVIINIVVTNNYKKEITKIKEQNTEVYRISSKDKEYKVDGYIIFNNKESLVIINELSERNGRTIDNTQKDITGAELNIIINGQRYTLNKIKNKKKVTKEEAVSRLITNKKVISSENSFFHSKSSNTIKFKLNFFNEVKDKVEYINLELSKEI